MKARKIKEIDRKILKIINALHYKDPLVNVGAKVKIVATEHGQTGCLDKVGYITKICARERGYSKGFVSYEIAIEGEISFNYVREEFKVIRNK